MVADIFFEDDSNAISSNGLEKVRVRKFDDQTIVLEPPTGQKCNRLHESLSMFCRCLHGRVTFEMVRLL